jgi:hypothetical protein
VERFRIAVAINALFQLFEIRKRPVVKLGCGAALWQFESGYDSVSWNSMTNDLRQRLHFALRPEVSFGASKDFEQFGQ